MSETLFNERLPLTNATITVRVIKSFAYRTCKNLVLRDINLEEMTAGMLKELVLENIKTAPGFKPYLNIDLDTLKLYTVAHGHKTQNLIINLENDELIFEDDKHLAAYDVENETEISFFNRAAYEEFKLNPEIKW